MIARIPKKARIYVHLDPNPQMLPGLKTRVSEKKDVRSIGRTQKANANHFVI